MQLVKSSRILSLLCLFVLLPSLQASTKHKKTRSHTATAKATSPAAAATITLKDGRLARIENGRVMLAQSSGKYVVAAPGRYSTRDGKFLLIGNEGRLTNSTNLKVEAAPQPEKKRTAPTSNGVYHQTGSHL
jgi:hypothetical protein